MRDVRNVDIYIICGKPSVILRRHTHTRCLWPRHLPRYPRSDEAIIQSAALCIGSGLTCPRHWDVTRSDGRWRRWEHRIRCMAESMARLLRIETKTMNAGWGGCLLQGKRSRAHPLRPEGLKDDMMVNERELTYAGPAPVHQSDGVRILLSSTVPPRKERHDSKQKRGEDSRDCSRLTLSAAGRITKHTDDSPAACKTNLNTLKNPNERRK